MSSFKRSSFSKAAPSAAAAGGGGGGAATATASSTSSALPGTRPWINGRALVSSGCSSLDSLALAGGLPLGGVTLLESDARGCHAATFASLFLAEGVVCDHACAVAGAAGRTPLAALASQLPALRSQHSKAAPAATTAAASGSDNNTGSASSASGGSDALKIAWQYRKYLPDQADGSGPAGGGPARPGGGGAGGGAGTRAGKATGTGLRKSGQHRRQAPGFAHSFDLSRTSSGDSNPVRVIESKGHGGTATGELLGEVEEFVQTSAKAGTRVVRVCVTGLATPMWSSAPAEVCHSSHSVSFVWLLHVH